MYHYAGPPSPAANEPRRYGALYIVDTSVAARLQAGMAVNDGCDTTIFSELGILLRQLNPYAKSYQMMAKVIEKQEELAKKAGRPCCDVAMLFKTEGQQLDLRRYNKPSANEVAAIVVG